MASQIDITGPGEIMGKSAALEIGEWAEIAGLIEAAVK